MVLSSAIANTPDSVAPGITFNQFGAPGCNKFPSQVGVLQKLGQANLVHDVELCRFPVGAEAHPAAKSLSVRGLELAELPHPPRALGSLKSGLVILEPNAPVVDRSGIEVAQESVLPSKLRNFIHSLLFPFQMMLVRYMQSERILFFGLTREDLGGWDTACGPSDTEKGRMLKLCRAKRPPNGMDPAFLLPNQNSVDHPAGGLV